MKSVDANLATGDLEKTFMDALGMSKVQVVLHACKSVDISDIFHADTGVAVSQTVLVCLMQQLGSSIAADGKSEFDVETEWLQEIVLVVDSTDAKIGTHVNGVKQQLIKHVGDAIAKLAQGKEKRKLTGLLQMVKGIAV